MVQTEYELVPSVPTLLRRLEENPRDWDARLLLAERYEERGWARDAAGQRWQSLCRKSPARGIERASWRAARQDVVPYFLPPDIFRLLSDGSLEGNWRSYASVQKADEALARALFPES